MGASCCILNYKNGGLGADRTRPPFAMAYTGGCAQSHASYGVNKGSNCLFISNLL